MTFLLTSALVLMNSLTFSFYGYDKYLAVKSKRRISEKNLLLLAFLGGCLGAFLGMLIFRHKIAKVSFVLKFVAVVLLQCLLMSLLYVMK